MKPLNSQKALLDMGDPMPKPKQQRNPPMVTEEQKSLCHWILEQGPKSAKDLAGTNMSPEAARRRFKRAANAGLILLGAGGLAELTPLGRRIGEALKGHLDDQHRAAVNSHR